MSRLASGRRAGAWALAASVVLSAATAAVGAALPRVSYYLTSTLIVLFTLLPFFASFEGRRPQARELAVLAVLTALAVVSRAVFAWVPHFKPMAGIVMIAGMAAGPQAGFLVGALSALTSNFLFGQGPWTPWQMLAFGAAGLMGGALTRLRLFPREGLSWGRRIALAVVGYLAVQLVVGPILDTSTLFYLMGSPSLALVVAIYAAGAPVNAIHGTATAATLLLAANPLLDQLARLRTKYGLLE
ncbi:ECF transporter S component [uncultured Adlercreutzia sp.]|uniref:ECF transporter S component n=1 Tax=uncultured Adlercreutzia sp. TaxID=875803 RepID=UPI0025FB72FA|nr:ECF transporter S component [uncultured Adlercreutzia sp.]